MSTMSVVNKLFNLKVQKPKLNKSRPKYLQTCKTSTQQALGRTDQQLIKEILKEIQDTDRGMRIEQNKQQKVDNKLRKLEELMVQQPDFQPVNDDRIFGNFTVAYTSTGKGQGSAPAGGRFREGIGRLMFDTRKVCQSIIKPDIVTNKVEFKLLNIFPGWVGLRGTFAAMDGSKDTVIVTFDQPTICLLNLFSFNIGRKSKVALKTTYLDDEIRLGKGGYGSLFVFQRGGESDTADMESVGLQTGPRKWLGTAFLCAFLIWMGCNGWGLIQSTNLLAKLGGSAVLFLTGGFVWIAFGLFNPQDPA